MNYLKILCVCVLVSSLIASTFVSWFYSPLVEGFWIFSRGIFFATLAFLPVSIAISLLIHEKNKLQRNLTILIALIVSATLTRSISFFLVKPEYHQPRYGFLSSVLPDYLFVAPYVFSTFVILIVICRLFVCWLNGRFVIKDTNHTRYLQAQLVAIHKVLTLSNENTNQKVSFFSIAIVFSYYCILAAAILFGFEDIRKTIALMHQSKEFIFSHAFESILCGVIFLLITILANFYRRIKDLEWQMMVAINKPRHPKDFFGNYLSLQENYTFNEDNLIEQSTHYQKHNEGHWMKIICRGTGADPKYFVEHIISHDSPTSKGKSFQEIASECVRANEAVFRKKGTSEIIVVNK